MTGLEGIRVMRGPDWQDGDTDGGEGHLGTLKQLLSNQTVRVLWDNGQESACRAGTDGKFDLRVFDTAQAGVRHPSTHCAECGENDIFGMLWRCQDCTGHDLCPLCYSEDKHDIRHRFLRLDHHTCQGQTVKKRKVSVRMRAMGTFPGAKVKRGHDWAWGDQDGGLGSIGEVKTFENIAPDSSRNLIKVQWSRGTANSYRHGYNGHVDLTCVEEEVGNFYYRDHLPLLDSANLPYPLAPKEAFTSVKQPTTAMTSESTITEDAASSTDTDKDTSRSAATADNSNDGTPSPSHSDLSTSSTGQQEQGPKVDQTSHSQDGGAVGGVQPEGEATGSEIAEKLSFSVGDSVAIAVKENELRDLQEDYGGVSNNMIKKMDMKGTVTEITTGVMVRFTSVPYRMNPAALVKVPSLKVGDVVRIHGDVDRVKFLNKHIAWNRQVAEVCGTAGRVTQVNNDDTVTVTFGHYQTFRFSPACCKPAPGATVDTVGAVGAARKAASAAAGTSVWADSKDRPVDASDVPDYTNDGDGTVDKSEKTNADSDSDSDMQKAMLRMMGMLGGSGGSGSDSDDPQIKILFSAISNGNVQAVETMLHAKMSLLTKTHQSLTPLMYACYEGQRQVVTKLLDMGADINWRNEKGRSALLVALDKRKEDIAIMLLGRGADPHVKNHRNRTAVHEAAYENLPQALQLLIEHGADVNAKDFVQDTPLFDAIEKGNERIVEVLLQVPSLNFGELNMKGFNMLQLAALKGKAVSMEMILSAERHPPVDETLLGEYTALHIAANNDHVECVGILVLLGGATIDIGDGRRQLTPLHLACKRRMFKSAEALLGLGATVNVVDNNGNTPLHLAIGKVLENDTDDSDVSRETAIEHRIKVARLLISNGAIVDIEDDQGRSPLSYGHREVQDGVRQFLREASGEDTKHQKTVDEKTDSPSATVGEQKDKTIPEENVGSKQYDTNLMNSLLQGVSIQCARCDAMSDVTLHPCGHKSVCRKCCDVITRCPVCDGAVEDKEFDNTDEPEEEPTGSGKEEKKEAEEAKEEEMNTFD